MLEEYLKASTSSGSAAPVSAVLRPAKVCLYESFTVAAAAVVVVVVVLVALEEYLKASTSSGSVARPAKVCQPHMSNTAQWVTVCQQCCVREAAVIDGLMAGVTSFLETLGVREHPWENWIEVREM